MLTKKKKVNKKNLNDILNSIFIYSIIVYVIFMLSGLISIVSSLNKSIDIYSKNDNIAINKMGVINEKIKKLEEYNVRYNHGNVNRR